MPYDRDQQTYPVKCWIVNALTLQVLLTQLCHYGVSGHRQSVTEQEWLHSNKTVGTLTFVSHILFMCQKNLLISFNHLKI